MTLAFLQNTYVRPHQVDRWRKAMLSPNRQRYLSYGLFGGCKTGRVLQKAGFDWDTCIWENISDEIGAFSNSCFAPSIEHIVKTINTYKPTLILAFGKVAARGLELVDITGAEIMVGPHPAARENVLPRLIEMRSACI